MLKLTLAIAVLVLFLSPALVGAQMELPKPAKELEPFEKLIGHWEGSGTATMGPGMPAMPWTSKSTYQWIMGGHFLQEELRVDIGQGMPPMVMRAIYGWDRNQKKLVSYNISNTGELSSPEHVAWVEGKLVTIGTSMKNGVPGIGRSVSTITESEMSFDMQEASGTGELATTVTGSMKRCETPYAIEGAEMTNGFMGAMAPPEMTKLQGMVGTYTMQGEWVAMPGAPAMPISGTEWIQPIFGGTMLMMHVKGDPSPADPTKFEYEGYAFIGWDADKGCYKEVWFNNMGETSEQEVRWVGDNTLVTTSAGMLHGKPLATRGTIELSETGAIVKASMDSMNAAHKPERAFFGNYTKKSDTVEKMKKAAETEKVEKAHEPK